MDTGGDVNRFGELSQSIMLESSLGQVRSLTYITQSLIFVCVLILMSAALCWCEQDFLNLFARCD